MSYRTGWGYSKEFFNATDTRNFFAGFHNAMEMEVEKMSDSEIVSCNFDEWANYLATKYSVIPISIFETNIERRLTEAKVKRAYGVSVAKTPNCEERSRKLLIRLAIQRNGNRIFRWPMKKEIRC